MDVAFTNSADTNFAGPSVRDSPKVVVRVTKVRGQIAIGSSGAVARATGRLGGLNASNCAVLGPNDLPCEIADRRAMPKTRTMMMHREWTEAIVVLVASAWNLAMTAPVRLANDWGALANAVRKVMVLNRVTKAKVADGEVPMVRPPVKPDRVIVKAAGSAAPMVHRATEMGRPDFSADPRVHRRATVLARVVNAASSAMIMAHPPAIATMMIAVLPAVTSVTRTTMKKAKKTSSKQPFDLSR
jgi:hypothetical protein